MPNTIWAWLLWVILSSLVYAPIVRWAWDHDGRPEDGIGCPTVVLTFPVGIAIFIGMRYGLGLPI